MEYSVFAKACPSRAVLDNISNKWTFLLLEQIRAEPRRFNQLRREVEGISQKMLSQTLKQLERDGMIHRRVYATVPVTVEYSITDLGESLTKAITVLTDWSEAHCEQVFKAQIEYDEKNSQEAAVNF